MDLGENSQHRFQSWPVNYFVQVEETSREREERLKGWSTFLDADQEAQKKNSNSISTTAAAAAAQAAQAAQPSSETEQIDTEEPKKIPESEPQASKEQEQEKDMDSTDSSLAGSDDDEAVWAVFMVKKNKTTLFPS